MHIEEFIKPVLGEDFSDEPLGYFTQEEMTVIKNAWRSIKKKADHKQILLPGRDVFIFEILARREGYPTIFVPECSRQTVNALYEKLGSSISDCYLFDTGFAGTIPKALRTKRFNMLSHHDMSGSVQVFPRLSFSRGLALKVEKTPKYWSSGRIDPENAVVQDQSDIFEFARAARLTIEVYRNSSPKFIEKHKPISGRRW
jgi:hypothetical protein